MAFIFSVVRLRSTYGMFDYQKKSLYSNNNLEQEISLAKKIEPSDNFTK